MRTIPIEQPEDRAQPDLPGLEALHASRGGRQLELQGLALTRPDRESQRHGAASERRIGELEVAAATAPAARDCARLTCSPRARRRRRHAAGGACRVSGACAQSTAGSAARRGRARQATPTAAPMAASATLAGGSVGKPQPISTAPMAASSAIRVRDGSIEASIDAHRRGAAVASRIAVKHLVAACGRRAGRRRRARCDDEAPQARRP